MVLGGVSDFLELREHAVVVEGGGFGVGGGLHFWVIKGLWNMDYLEKEWKLSWGYYGVHNIKGILKWWNRIGKFGSKWYFYYRLGFFSISIRFKRSCLASAIKFLMLFN